MKKLLATALALSTIGVLPVKAGSVWLIMKEAVKPHMRALFGIANR